jgi:hypothetical protein
VAGGVPGTAAIDADLDRAIEAIIGANSQYQVGVALMDTAGGPLHMQGTNYEELIPAAVPDGVAVFHKYGLLDDELHDAAILSTSAGRYALMVYTKGTGPGDVPQRTAVIHDITEAVTAVLF